jgi:hypothetical protein
MATKKQALPDRGSIDRAISAASEVVSQEDPGIPHKGDPAQRPIAIRLNEYEYRRLKSLFAKEGVKLSTGIKLCALWMAEQLEDQALKLTRASIIDRRC